MQEQNPAGRRDSIDMDIKNIQEYADPDHFIITKAKFWRWDYFFDSLNYPIGRADNKIIVDWCYSFWISKKISTP